MAQLSCIGLYKPCINLPFGDCAMYFDHGVVVVSTPKMSCQIPTMKVQYPLEVSPTKYLPSPAAFSRMGAASFS